MQTPQPPHRAQAQRKPRLSPYVWRVIRRSSVVVGLTTILLMVGYRFYNSQMDREIAFCAREYCEPDTAYVWWGVILVTTLSVVAAIMAILLVRTVVEWIFAPGPCEGCHCRNHKRSIYSDNTAVVTTVSTVVIVVIVIFILVPW